MSVQQLFDVLSSVKTDKKSGKVYVYIKENNKRLIGTIFVADGEITSIVFARKTGRMALEEMRSLNIENAVFLPQSTTEKSTQQSPDTPAMATVLGKLKNNSADSGSRIGTAELKNQAEEILKKVYGPSIVKEVDRLATTCLIEQNPKAFLEQCQAKAQLMLSKKQVDELFKPLYDGLKTG